MGLGDELMVTGQARRAQERDARRVQVFDRRGRARWHELWERNPRIARPDERGDFQALFNGAGQRPYIDYARSSPDRWAWHEWECPAGELHGIAPDPRGAGRIVIEPALKPGASPNKAWPWWRELVARDRKRRWAQLCPPGVKALPGVERIETKTFREACAVLSAAAGAVLPEGGLHHAAAAVGLQAVVIFGGYISPRQTGYALHCNLFTGGEPCGWRTPCRHCQQAMRAITPEMVLANLGAIDGQRAA